jgi:hypothetical protein
MRAFALSLLVALLVAGCGGSDESTPVAATTTAAPPPPEETTTEEAETTTEAERPKALPGLPRYTAGYEDWTKLNRGRIPPREGGDAHLGTKNVYASRERRANGRFPNRTIIVKEAARPGKDFIGLVAVMRKIAGADPAHNDWVFIEWTREGPKQRFTEAARDAVCWSCHVGAAQNDYVWIYELGIAR